MNLFERLKKVVEREHKEGELPDFTVKTLLSIADSPLKFSDKEYLIAVLVRQVEEYQTYSEMCCEKAGYSIEDIERTLQKLEVEISW